ncbi:glutathione synthase, partial [Moraxella catarrhalis]|nr:glutathione synthase [Moraxella catarrhalis]
MKKLRFLIVMDDITTVSYKKDTTLAMMWAADERGHELYYCQIHDLWLSQGTLNVDAQPLQVFKNPENFYELGEMA